LKREQARQGKKSKTKKEDSDSSDSEKSVEIVERITIPRKRSGDLESEKEQVRKARKLKDFCARLATIEEERAFLKKITHEDPEKPASDHESEESESPSDNDD
jgi:hypothetical protein